MRGKSTADGQARMSEQPSGIYKMAGAKRQSLKVCTTECDQAGSICWDMGMYPERIRTLADMLLL